MNVGITPWARRVNPKTDMVGTYSVDPVFKRQIVCENLTPT